ncbi:MAG: hypothetical protein K9L17_10690 [Clostridiales bacterium]|nr:hypothetical protein [Clostridiales bacterium]
MDSSEQINDLLDKGTDIIGGSIGGVIGFLLGGPGGAAVGELTGVLVRESLNKFLSDMASRELSIREKDRVGACARCVIDKIRAKIMSGEEVRDDGFFPRDSASTRSPSEEIFEGILLKCKNEHEEKKIHLNANIFVNIAFKSNVSIGEANHLMQIAESLTYRQLCLLSLFKIKDIEGIKLRDFNLYKTEYSISYETLSVLQEVLDLINNWGMVGTYDFENKSMGNIVESIDLITPNNLMLTEYGKRLCEILNIEEINRNEINELIDILKRYY